MTKDFSNGILKAIGEIEDYMRINKILEIVVWLLIVILIFILVTILGLAVGVVNADNGNCQNQVPDCDVHTDYGNIRYICTDSQYDYYKVTLNGAYSDVFVGDYASGTSFIFDTSSSITRQFLFPAGSNWAQLWVGSDFVSLSDAQDTRCSTESNLPEQPVVPMVECVGFVIEGLTVFEIDGIIYHTSDGFVSFLVPQDAFWTWVMTSNGVYVMTFIQDQVNNCYVLNINPDWNNAE